MEVDGEGWECDSCTFENNGQDAKCEMCGSERKTSSAKNAGKKPTTTKSREGGSQSQELDPKADVASRHRRKRRAASRGDDEDEYEGEPASRSSGTDLIVDDAQDDERLNRLVAQMQKLNKKTVPVEQPSAVVNCELKPHQLVALSWLVSLYTKGLSGILGDEMGLGKTLTAISLLAHLMEEKQNHGPFLVVAPLSVVDHWGKEIKKYAPTIKSLTYLGEKEEREELRRKMKKNDASVQFNVLITTPELLMCDSDFLQRYKWRYAIVDEAHRLKNSDAVFYRTLLEFRISHKLLMTGTPLQNNLKELWALLHFVAPNTFNDLDLFERWFKDINWTRMKDNEEAETGKELVTKLQELIRPFLLRRRLNNVNLELPAKRELIVYTGLSAMQKKYYKWILTRNIDKLTKGTGGWGMRRGGNRTSLSNVIMEMRKCCNHPYLFDGAEPEFDGQFILGEHIVENSGKLVLLDKLLAKLYAEGRKVLVFSQMTRMLDIVQDYLHYRSYNYERLDGSVRGEERFLAINRFTADTESEDEDDRPFVFLLSTRAGGLGLNLTVADTVIFLDSDWNPQSDLQAEARVHRIGQTKDVTVIRLITKDTVEELILQRALRKLQLSSAVIEEGKFRADQDEEKETPEQLFDIIQYGLSKVINDDDSTIEDEDIDSILAKSEENMKNLSINQVLNQQVSVSQAPTMLPDEEDTSTENIQSKDAEKDAEALDAIMESALLAKAGAIAPSSKLGATPHKQRRHLRGRSVDFNPEEEQARKQEKIEQRRKKMWKANKYISSAIIATRWVEEDKSDEAEDPNTERAMNKEWTCGSCTFVNGRENDECQVCSSKRTVALDAQETEAIDLDDEGREANDIHFVVGDVTKPIPPKHHTYKNSIVVTCVDDSGSWGHGGLFRSLDQLSTLIAERYTEAGQNKDIQLSDLHLIFKQKRTLEEEPSDDDLFCRPSDCAPITHSEGQGRIFAALVIAQTCKRNVVSPIQLPAFSQALQKLAPVARALKASVHLPRMGLRGSDWYAAERAIRRYLVSHGIPTYVYYFKRGGRQKRRSMKPSAESLPPRSLLTRSTSASQIVPATPPPTPASQSQASVTDEVVRPSDEPRRPQKKRRLITPDDDDQVAVTTSSPPTPASKFLKGLRFYLHLVGPEYNSLKSLIKRYGGKVVNRYSKETTHLLTAHACETDESVLIAKEINPNVSVVTPNWLSECARRSSLV